jgi:AhpD family alkylhydroperoxidase
MAGGQGFKELAEGNRPHRIDFVKLNSDAMKAFGAFDKAIMSDGVLDTKVKELIAVAISAAIRCDDCIGFHVQAALKAGATREEIAEALSVCVLMQGGPGLMYATHAMKALNEFSES